MSRRRAVLLSMSIASSILSFFGCRFSTTELPGTVGDVRVTIDIEQRTERQPEGRDPYEFTHVNVVLADGKGAAIEKPDVKVLMNGEPLAFRVGTGNYYDRHPRYMLPDEELGKVRPDTEYAFSVIWIDGSTIDAGRIRTPKPLALTQISVPETHRAGAPLDIVWRDVAEPCELVAYHGFEFPDEHGNMVQQSGSVNTDDVLRQTIGSGKSSGRMQVPASYFAAEGKRRVASFGAEITCAAETPVGKPFAAGSRIRAVRTLTYRTDIPAPAAR
jgi:hypothetical protein